MQTVDLFQIADFDRADIAAAVATRVAQVDAMGQTQALRRRATIRTRRVHNAEKLTALLPVTINIGDTWHVLSSGDIDVLSFTRHLLAGAGWFDELFTTTWRINLEDIQQVREWMDAGLVAEWHLLIDQRFQRLAPDNYQAAKAVTDTYGGSVCMALNHSKVTMASNAQHDTWLVLESSANINTNNRLEQTTITNDKTLHTFYSRAFHGIRRRNVNPR